MPHTIFNKLPKEEWTSDKVLRYCPWGNDPNSGTPIVWRTGQNLGTLEPFSTTEWSIHTGLPRNAPCRAIHYFSDGYTLFYVRNEVLHELHLWAIHPRAVVIVCTEMIHPEIISFAGELTEEDGNAQLRLNQETINLVTKEVETGCRILLTSESDDLPHNLKPCTALMDLDVSTSVNRRFDRRAEFWSTWEEGLPERTHIHQSTEALLYSLRDADGLFDDLWIEDGHSNRSTLNHLLVQLAALSWLDAKMALRVIRTACGLLTPEGRMAAFSGTEPATLAKTGAWPQICRATASASNHLAEYSSLKRLIPKLHSILLTTLQTHYHGDTQLYLWPSAAESFLPDLYDEDLATVDCASFLLAEIDAYLNVLERSGMEMEMDLSKIDKHRSQLEKSIQTFFAHPASHSYRDRMIEGDSISRLTLSSITPIITSLPNSDTLGILARSLESPDQLKTDNGYRDWEPWEDDEAPPQVNVSRQFQFLPLDTSTIFMPIGALQKWQETSRSFVELSSYTREGMNAQAALYLHSTSLILQPDIEKEPPPWLVWLEKRRKWVLPIPIALFLLILFGVTASYQTKRTPPRNTIQALVGLAQHHYQMDEQNEALELLTDLYESGVRTPTVINILAKSHFRAGHYAEAEEFFQSMNRIQPNPGTELNIALSVYQQGRLEEAEALYREIGENYRTIQPQISERADLCIELLNYGPKPPRQLLEEK